MSKGKNKKAIYIMLAICIVLFIVCIAYSILREIDIYSKVLWTVFMLLFIYTVYLMVKGDNNEKKQ